MKSPFFSLGNRYNALAGIVLLGLVLSAVISFLLIRPAWQKLERLGQEIPQAEQARDKVKLDFANLEKSKEYFEDNDSAVEKVNTAVPIDAAVPEVLVILDALAKQNGVTLTSFAPQQAGGGGTANTGLTALPTGTSSIEVTANYQGRYEAMTLFFYALERNLRIVDVRTISFAGGGVASSGQQLSGTIAFRVYYQADTPDAQAPAPGTGTVAP